MFWKMWVSLYDQIYFLDGKNAMELQIDFYSKNEASVQIAPDLSIGDEWSLFALYTLRQLHNQGRHAAAIALAKLLTDLPEGLIPLGEAKLISLPRTDRFGVDARLDGCPTLVPYRGKGRKQFVVTLTPRRSGILLYHSGFGMLGIGIPHYANFSVLALLRRLKQKHPGDEVYELGLRVVAAICGELYLNNAITLTNQGELTHLIMDRLARWQT